MSDSRAVHILLFDADPQSISAIVFFVSQIENCTVDVVTSTEHLHLYIKKGRIPDLLIFSVEAERNDAELFSSACAKNSDIYSIVLLPEFNLSLAKEYRERGAHEGVFRLDNYLGNLRRAVRKGFSVLRSMEGRGFAQQFEPGKAILHYNLLELVGAGIRTDVYKAQDEKQNCAVTVKILPPCIAGHPVLLRRLEREARAASRLQHSAFVKVHAVEETDGVALLVTESLEGESLASLLSKGSMGMFHLMDIGSQLSEALEVAHRAGIIHGNLKPENIFVTPYGTAKILDFGQPQKISSAVSRGLDGLLELSRSGVPYDSLFSFSPEQAGGGDVDPRSDVFSLASVLYHAATGEFPFEGSDPAVILENIRSVDVEPPGFWKSHLQGEFDEIILLAMQRDPKKRLASASELQRVLGNLKSRYIPEEKEEISKVRKKPSRVVEVVPQKSRTPAIVAALCACVFFATAIFWWLSRESKLTTVAVLPPQYSSENQSFGSVSVALMDAFIQQLSVVPKLLVIQPVTSFHYIAGANPAAAGKHLNADFVLSGKLTEKSNRLYLSVEWTDVQRGAPVWRRLYQLEMNRFFQIRSDLTAQIFDSLGITSASHERKMAIKRTTQSIAALKMYSQGKYRYYEHSRESLEESIRLYDLALSNDSSFVEAHAGKALSHLDLAESGVDEMKNFESALRSATKALELDDHISDAHMIVGAVSLLSEWNFKTAEEELNLAIVLNPNSSRARSYLAFLYVSRRQLNEAFEQMTAAQKRDPLSPVLKTELIYLLTIVGRYDQAIALAQTNMDAMDPIRANLLLGDAYLGMKDADQALLAYRRCQELGQKDAPAKIAMVMADSGMKREAITLLENLTIRGKQVNPDWIAAAYARLGDPERALEWLQISSEAHPSSLIFLRVDPKFDSLRQNRQFDDFLRKSGL